MAQPYEGLGRILVIIPTYNEIENVDMITSRLRAAVPQAHLLIADDNSPDGTGKRADELAEADDHIHVVHRHGKEGLGKAYLDAFRWGLAEGYDVLVEHDAPEARAIVTLPEAARIASEAGAAPAPPASASLPRALVVARLDEMPVLARRASCSNKSMREAVTPKHSNSSAQKLCAYLRSSAP